MTKDDEFRFKNTNICWFCEQESLDNKVRDHCHLTGKYRGVAHYNCNIYVREKTVILFRFCFIILVTMIVICFSKS